MAKRIDDGDARSCLCLYLESWSLSRLPFVFRIVICHLDRHRDRNSSSVMLIDIVRPVIVDLCCCWISVVALFGCHI